jgi:hypothetical protein
MCDEDSMMWVLSYETDDCTGQNFNVSYDCSDADSYCSCDGDACGSAEVSISDCDSGDAYATYYYVVDACLPASESSSYKYTCASATSLTYNVYSTGDCSGDAVSVTYSEACSGSYKYTISDCEGGCSSHVISFLTLIALVLFSQL